MALLSDLYYEPEYLATLTARRLAELNRTRTKVAEYERRASALSDYEHERRKLSILAQLGASSPHSSLGPQLRDMGQYITELKQYLQSVYDADLLGDYALKTLATEHCVSYTVRLLELLSDSTKYDVRGSLGVLDLAASTLAMFSGRPTAVPVLLRSGAVPVMCRTLSPLFPPCVVINFAAAVGNMADDLDVRLAFRAHGGVSALVRLLRGDVEPSVQAAAASALGLLASRDLIVQDSVRYLGGIDLLVSLLASDDWSLSEAARRCLAAVRAGNPKNQREAAVALRTSSSVALATPPPSAVDLRRYEDSASSVRSLIEDLDSWGAATAAARPRSTADSLLRPASAVVGGSVSLRPASVAATNPRTPVKLFDSGRSVLPSPASTVQYTSASAKDYTSLTLPASPGVAAEAAAEEWRLGSTLVELESDLLRRKHLARFSSEEVCMLLEEMGFDALDLRGFRLSRVSGTRLLTMSEDELSIDMLLVRSKVRKVLQLQRAALLFDRIATLPRQGRVSEVELRLYLAGQGAGSNEVDKVVQLFRTLVRTDRFDFVTFWDFVTSYEWIAQSFRIYGIAS